MKQNKCCKDPQYTFIMSGEKAINAFNEAVEDNYDIIAKVPITKQFKIKVKIKSIKRFTPKVSLD